MLYLIEIYNFYFYVFFKIEFPCEAMAVLEFTMQSVLASNSDSPVYDSQGNIQLLCWGKDRIFLQ